MHYRSSDADARLLWDNAPGNVRESWIELFSCKIDSIDACEASISKYLRGAYTPFIIIFFVSSAISFCGSIISYFWISHIHQNVPTRKIDSKEAFEIFVLR
jgi:hypothetical protein